MIRSQVYLSNGPMLSDTIQHLVGQIAQNQSSTKCILSSEIIRYLLSSLEHGPERLQGQQEYNGR